MVRRNELEKYALKSSPKSIESDWNQDEGRWFAWWKQNREFITIGEEPEISSSKYILSFNHYIGIDNLQISETRACLETI